ELVTVVVVAVITSADAPLIARQQGDRRRIGEVELPGHRGDREMKVVRGCGGEGRLEIEAEQALAQHRVVDREVGHRQRAMPGRLPVERTDDQECRQDAQYMLRLQEVDRPALAWRRPDGQ